MLVVSMLPSETVDAVGTSLIGSLISQSSLTNATLPRQAKTTARSVR